MINMQGSDPNRHIAYMNNNRPYANGTVRPPVPVLSQQTIDGHLQYVLARIPLGGGLVSPAINQFKENYRTCVNRWHIASAGIDGGVVPPKSKFLSMLGVFILDTLAFTFTFFGLFETLFEASQHGIDPGLRDPVPYLIIIPSAAVVAAFVTLAIKKLAAGAVKDRGAKIAYFAGWILFACADFYYLMSKNVTGVGVIATGLLVVMCALTLVHAGKDIGVDPDGNTFTTWDNCHRETYDYNQRLHATLMYIEKVENPDGMQVVSLLTNWSNVDANILRNLGIPHVMNHLGQPKLVPIGERPVNVQAPVPTNGQSTQPDNIQGNTPVGASKSDNPSVIDSSGDKNEQRPSGGSAAVVPSTGNNNQQLDPNGGSTKEEVDIIP